MEIKQLLKFLLTLTMLISFGQACFLPGTTSAQDFMMQGWYWDYPGTGDGKNWADSLNNKAQELSDAGITYLWLPPLSRASSGNNSNGYDPKDLYDLGEYGGGATRFGERSDLNDLITTLNSKNIKAVADVVYNHRDGGDAEDNSAVEGWIEGMTWQKAEDGDNAFPSDRFRCYLPIGGATGYGTGNYYFKIRSASWHARFDNFQYKVYVETNTIGWQGSADVNESEPNGGGDCGQANDAISLGINMMAYTDDVSACITDEFHLSLSGSDYNASGDTIWIYLSNQGGNYSDHYIQGLWYDGGGGANIQSSIKYQAYTDFTNMPSGSGSMNYLNFKPNGNATQLAGDWDWPWFFYDYDQNIASTVTGLQEWTRWLWNTIGIRGYRMDAVKHFDYAFVGDLLDNLHDNSIDPDLVVGEFYESNSATLKGWVDNVLANMDVDTKAAITPRIFDFSLRSALEAASDQFGNDVRNVFTASIVDAQSASGSNVVTFTDNHDFRDTGQPIDNDPILAYAYILTNNQVGLPCVYYKDYYDGGLENEINVLINIHKNYIYGASQRDYLGRSSTPYSQTFTTGYATTTLFYQLNGATAGNDVLVAINYAGEALNVTHGVKTSSMNLAVGDTLVDMVGYSSPPFVIVDGSGNVQFEIPTRGYSVWVEGAQFSDTETVNSTTTYNFNESTEGGNAHDLDINFTALNGSGDVTVRQRNYPPADVPGLNVCDYYWEITAPGGITSFTADLTFHYTYSDALNYTESAAYFGIAKLNESSNTWQWLGGTVDGTNNTVSVSGVDSFSKFALFRCIFGDITNNGYVDAADLQRLGDCWHQTNAGEFTSGTDARFFNYNKNTDGDNQIIDAADLQVFGDCWHNGVPGLMLMKSNPLGKPGIQSKK